MSGSNEGDIATFFLSKNYFGGQIVKDCKSYNFRQLEEVYLLENGNELTHAIYYTGWNKFNPTCVRLEEESNGQIEERDCDQNTPSECLEPKILELAVSIDGNCFEEEDLRFDETIEELQVDLREDVLSLSLIHI